MYHRCTVKAGVAWCPVPGVRGLPLDDLTKTGFPSTTSRRRQLIDARNPKVLKFWKNRTMAWFFQKSWPFFDFFKFSNFWISSIYICTQHPPAHSGLCIIKLNTFPTLWLRCFKTTAKNPRFSALGFTWYFSQKFLHFSKNWKKCSFQKIRKWVTNFRRVRAENSGVHFSFVG